MIELGQLEKHHEDFARRNVRVAVVSVEGRDDAEKTQAEYPHLTVVSDSGRRLIKVASVVHAHANPNGDDAAAPATIRVDGSGIVRWVFRPDRYLTRLTPEELLDAVDRNLP